MSVGRDVLLVVKGDEVVTQDGPEGGCDEGGEKQTDDRPGGCPERRVTRAGQEKSLPAKITKQMIVKTASGAR